MMRKLLIPAAVAASLSLAACSDRSDNALAEEGDAAAADAQANADEVGNAVSTAASDAAAAATDTKNRAEANLQGESKNKAAKD